MSLLCRNGQDFISAEEYSQDPASEKDSAAIVSVGQTGKLLCP